MSSIHAKLTVDLDAIVFNWRSIQQHVKNSTCAAVVKADAYGLGLERVAEKLYAEGCRHFFVASLQEARQLKGFIGGDADIYVLTGLFPGEERVCYELGIVPVLVSFEMLKRWIANVGPSARAALKFDTGMGRLGFSEPEVEQLFMAPELIHRAGVELVISHLACADTPAHELNVVQLNRFKQIRYRLLAQAPSLRFSLANSAASVSNVDSHFDMVRPGVALYGSVPVPEACIPLRPVVSLTLPIIQTRKLLKGASAGYGALFVAEKDCHLAVAAGGYADGLFRTLGNRGAGFLRGKKVPIVGRISMDTTLFDVSFFAGQQALAEHEPIEILGLHQGIDQLAESAGTIAYEILTSLGERFNRRYIDARDTGTRR